MTDRPPDPADRARPSPEDEAALLDLAQGRLDPAAVAALRARLARESALAAEAGWIESVLAAERLAFEPPLPATVWESDAARVAARVRDEARRLETRSPVRRAAGGLRRQGWARVLAFSVGVHVVLLGVLLFINQSQRGAEEAGPPSFMVSAGSDFHESDPGLAERDVAMRYLDVAYDDVGLSDHMVLLEQETLADELPLEAGGRAQPDPRVNDHPGSVFVPMSRRKHLPTKRSRLRLLGFNAQGTMRAVELGLRYLTGEQAGDGSFAAGGGRDALEQTSLALLAFLGDGHCSRHREGDASGRAVQRGIAWLRKHTAKLGEPGAPGLGLATIALSEDYMLSYGWLSPVEAQHRVTEIDRLTRLLRLTAPGNTAPGNTAPGSDVATPWRTWALDAAARAGVIEATPQDRRHFSAWVHAASTANGTLSATSAFGALAVSTALLYQERGAKKPRFLDWSRTHAETLVKRLSPIGKAKTGDPVGETASILLALQVAYRTY